MTMTRGRPTVEAEVVVSSQGFCQVHYAASKGALATLSIASAAYYAPRGIRINMVAPALTTSRMSERAAADEATVARKLSPWFNSSASFAIATSIDPALRG